MNIPVQILTALLMLVVILLAGCSALGIITGKAVFDAYNQTEAYNQADFGPVSQDSRVPIELPPYPDPSFESLIEQFKVDVAANRGYLDNKKRAIADPKLLRTSQVPGYQVHQISPKGYHPAFWGRYWQHPDNEWGYRSQPYHPYNNMVLFRKHNQRGELLRNIGDVGNIRNPKGVFTGKIFYTTKRQEIKLATLSGSGMYDSSEDYYRNVGYYRKKWTILAEKIDPLVIAKHMSQIRVHHGYDKKDIVGIEFAERAMQKYPNSAEAMYYSVICLSAEEQLAGYQRLLEKFPNAAFAHFRIAHLYLQQDKVDEAIVHIQKAIQLDKFISLNKSFLAQCYAKRGELEKAIAAYQSSASLTAEQRMDLLNAQRLFIRTKIEMLRQVYERNSDHPDADVLYGLVQLLHDVYPQESVEYTQKFLKLYTHHEMQHKIEIWLAVSYYLMGEYEKALAQYKIAYNVVSFDFPHYLKIHESDIWRIRAIIGLLEKDDTAREDSKTESKKWLADRRKRLGLKQ